MALLKITLSSIWGSMVCGFTCLSIILSTTTVSGEEVLYRSMEGNANIHVGARTWISKGRTTWDHDASTMSSLFGNPTSELDYKDVSSKIVEINGYLVHQKGFSIRGDVGYGRITDGLLVDDDFLSASGASAFGASLSGEHRFSRTHSDIDGSYILYFNTDLGLLFLPFADGKGLVNAVLGFQYWREKYEAKSVRQIECTVVGVLCNAAGTESNIGQVVISNTVVWRSIKVGGEGMFQFTDWLGVEGRAFFLPLAWLHNEDIHHLRTDLKQDPSIKMTGLGYGYNFEGLVRLRVFDNFFVHGGYRYWWLQVKDGDIDFRFQGGSSPTLNLNNFRTFRQGAIAGISYLF